MGLRNCYQHSRDWRRGVIYINETRVMLALESEERLFGER